MIHAAEATGRVLWCGFNHRFHPAVQQLRAWVDGGEIGDPRIVRARYGIGGRPGYEREWRADPTIVSGGQLMEQGIHAVDLARWFLGEFTESVGMTSNAYWQTQPLEDNAFVLLRTRDGRMASIHSSLTQWKNLFSFEVLGTAGIARAEGLGGSYGLETASLHKLDFKAPFAETSVEFRGEDPCWRNEWAAFQTAVKDGDLDSGRDGLAALHIVERAYASER